MSGLLLGIGQCSGSRNEPGNHCLKTMDSLSIQIAFTCYAIFFPMMPAFAFFITLWKKPYVLYPPESYKDMSAKDLVNAMSAENKINEDILEKLKDNKNG